MRKLFAFSLLLLNFLVLPSAHAKDEVVIDVDLAAGVITVDWDWD